MRLSRPLGDGRSVSIEIRDAFEQLARRAEILRPELADWMHPAIIRNQAAGLPAREALQAWQQDGRLASTLTAKGLELGEPALSAIYMAPVLALGRIRQIINAEDAGWRLRVSVVDDRRTCAAAVAMHRRVLAVGERLHFPLPECDALSCRCGYIAVPPWRTVD